MIDKVIENVKVRIDKASLTLIMTTEPKTRRFISEALITYAILFLVQQYCAGFLKGIGLEDRAIEDGKRTAEFLRKFKSGQMKGADLEEEKKKTEAAIQDVRSKAITSSAKLEAKAYVEDTLVEAGAVREQARDVTQALSDIILND